MLSTLNCKQGSMKAFAWTDGQGQCVVWQQKVNVLQWEGVPGVSLEASQGQRDWNLAVWRVSYN